MSISPDGEVELDFTNVDRISQHLAEDAGDEDVYNTDEKYDIVDIPVWHETEDELYDLYSRDSLVKGLKLIKAKRVNRVEGRPELYNISGSDLYVARIIELGEGQVPGVTCTCPNGSNRSGRPTCYHSAAALVKHLGGKHPKVITLLEHFKKK